MCVRSIIVGGLDNVVDLRTALSEHLNVIMSTNTLRRALHEACLGSLEKKNKPLLTTKNVRTSQNLLNIIKIGLKVGFLVTGLRLINFV